MKNISIMVPITIALVFLFTGSPASADETDDRIVDSIRNSYVFRTILAEEDVMILSEDGDVTLAGTVSDEYHKTIAEDTAACMPGVDSVDNRLVVKSRQAPADRDSLLEAKIKAMLLFHANVSALRTVVEAIDGTVTLRGEADTQAQKELTGEIAGEVIGVVEVVNEMNVVGRNEKKKRSVGETIDDASITAQVKMSLMLHRSTSALRTQVDTRKGVVSLYGMARSEAEKEMATRIALDTKGVKKVRNRMAVE